MKKIIIFFVLLMMSSASFAVGSNLRGDCDMNCRVNIDDVTCLINCLLSQNASGINLASADCDIDGRVNIDDLTTLIGFLLSHVWPEVTHDCIDLGLLSGTLWATCNIGADSPEDYGDHFAWGETAAKERYDWTTYKWGGYDSNGVFHLDKCNTNSQYGPVDNKLELDHVDDAAYVNWGSPWRMPTMTQQEELVVQCTWLWTTRNGVNGYVVTVPNGNSIFLPAAGAYRESAIWWQGDYGHYWSYTLYGPSPYNCFCIQFNSDNYSNGYADSRSEGWNVRSVRMPYNECSLCSQTSDTLALLAD